MDKVLNYYITTTPDTDENEGGLFCQVYTDEGCENEIDYFCVHKDEMDNYEGAIKEYIKAHKGELAEKRRIKMSEKKEREELLAALEDSVRTLERHNYFYDASNIKRAIKFIEEQELGG